MKNLLTRTAAVFTLSVSAGSAVAGDKLFTSERVSFQADGQTIVGTLYLPATSQKNPFPAMVVGGSLTSVKEQMAGTYAKELAERGIAALAIDYRHYGESAGLPRQLEDTNAKKTDLKAAVSYLATVAKIDPKNIGLLGVCTSGGNVLQAAAEDRRVKTVATVAGWFPEPAVTPALYGGAERINALKADGANALKKYRASGQADMVQVYGLAGANAAHVGDHLAYYFDAKRGNIAQWTNQMATQSWQSWLAFDPVSAAKNVTAATMIVHSDDSAMPEQARKVFASLPGRKELKWMQGGHFDFYDNDAKVNEAANEIARFVKDNAAAAARAE